jgi:hypothetical protein
MAMLTYEMGLIINYMLYIIIIIIIILEELIVTQIVKKFTNFVNWFFTSLLELTIGSCADLDGSTSQTPSSAAI